MVVELYTYTGTKLASEVKTQFGDTGSVQITDAHILAWINNGQRSIASTNDFLEKTFTTNLLAGQSIYDLDALMTGQRVKSYSSVIANGRKLKFVPWAKFSDDDWADTPPGDPTHYTEYASKLTLLPAPSTSTPAALSVYFHGWPADIASLTDQLTVPDRFYNALSQYVFARALELDENFEAAAGQLAQHAASLAVEAGRLTLSPTDAYPTITFVENW